LTYEIINNPSSKYDANGNAGIINIIMKKNKKEGFNGKFGLTSGFGALWIRKKICQLFVRNIQLLKNKSPNFKLSQRKKQIYFSNIDVYIRKTLNKNEFVQRRYDDGNVINQQLKRNRDTNFFYHETGMDWYQMIILLLVFKHYLVAKNYRSWRPTF
jgi:hypothetical protein